MALRNGSRSFAVERLLPISKKIRNLLSHFSAICSITFIGFRKPYESCFAPSMNSSCSEIELGKTVFGLSYVETHLSRAFVFLLDSVRAYADIKSLAILATYCYCCHSANIYWRSIYSFKSSLPSYFVGWFSWLCISARPDPPWSEVRPVHAMGRDCGPRDQGRAPQGAGHRVLHQKGPSWLCSKW